MNYPVPKRELLMMIDMAWSTNRIRRGVYDDSDLKVLCITEADAEMYHQHCKQREAKS